MVVGAVAVGLRRLRKSDGRVKQRPKAE
jgi:hypothetical protein